MNWKDVIKQDKEPVSGPFNSQEEASEHIMFKTDHFKNSQSRSGPTYEAKEENGKWYVYERCMS